MKNNVITIALTFTLAASLTSCKTPSVINSGIGQDAELIVSKRGAPGAIMSKAQADNAKLQQEATHGDINLSNAKHSSKIDRIHDGLDILSRIPRF